MKEKSQPTYQGQSFFPSKVVEYPGH